MERLYLSVQVSKKGSEEDAPPLGEEFSGTSVLGVFDGLGGAGSVNYSTPNGSFSGAYLGSRLAKSSVRDWMRLTLNSGKLRQDARQELTLYLQDKLRERVNSLPPSGSRLRSSMLRTLPTTLVVLVVNVQNDPFRVVCDYFWAGDSRAYVLTPNKGLQQLTRDHLKGGSDAYENLSADSPVSNCVCADRPFYLSASLVAGDGPAVFLAATDGCFGYLQTPILFEEMILEALVRSDSPEEWQELLTASVERVSGDDATLSAVCVGFQDFAAMKKMFAPRHELVRARTQPLRHKRAEREKLRSRLQIVDAEYSAELRSAWSDYRELYEGILPTVDGAEGDQ